jgi:hypothetical protein
MKTPGDWLALILLLVGFGLIVGWIVWRITEAR